MVVSGRGTNEVERPSSQPVTFSSTASVGLLAGGEGEMGGGIVVRGMPPYVAIAVLVAGVCTPHSMGAAAERVARTPVSHTHR